LAPDRARLIRNVSQLEETVKPPDHVQNVAQWQNYCRKIRARAIDLLEGRLGVIEAARELSKLAYWTDLRSDDDLATFVAIDSETDALPVGDVRQYWSAEALQRKDPEIQHAEELYRQVALEAAERLTKRFTWALDARNERRTRRTDG
jgi:hypothetical protein